MASIQTGTILGTVTGTKGKAGEVEVRISWTAIPRVDNTGHDVSFDLQTRIAPGGSSSTSDGNPAYVLKINNQIVFSQTSDTWENEVNYNKYTKGVWYTLVSAPKTFIPHTGVTTIPLYGQFDLESPYVDKGTVDGTIELEAFYTFCSAPTSLISNEDIPAQGSAITLNWEGAQAGTSNPITGYRLRWKANTASEYSYSNKINNTGSSGSTKWTAGWAAGTKIEISIMTIGTVSGYDSEYSDPIEITINTAPTWETDPVLSQTRFYKGFSGSIEASLRAKDGDEGDSVVYYYSTSNNFANASEISNNTITISGGDPSFIYFWASDRKNQSEVKTVELSYYLIDPGNFEVSSPPNSTYTADEVEYHKSFTLTAEKPENVLRYRFYYGRGTVPDQFLVEQPSETYNIPNIYELRYYPLPNEPWSFGVEFVYNVDDNETVSSMAKKVMTVLPPVGQVVRKGEVPSFSNEIICNLPDTGINRLDIQTSPQSATAVSYEIDLTNNQIILDTSKLTNGVSYTFSILPYRDSQSGITSTFSATKIYSLSFQNISFSRRIAYPHDYSKEESGGTFDLYFTNPFASLQPSDYGLNDAEDIEILVGYGNKTYNLSDNIVLDKWKDDDDNYNGFLVKTIPFNFFNTMVAPDDPENSENLGIVDYTGQYPLTFSLTANGVTTSASTNFILNFDKPPKITKITDFLVSSNNNISLIQQGDELAYTITFDYYNSYSINTNINISRAENKIDRRWKPYTSSQTDNWTSAQDLGVPKSGEITLYKKVEQITESNYINFSVTLSSIGSSNGDSNTVEWNPVNLPVSVKHVSPELTISGGYYSDGEIGFNYNFLQTDKGIDVLGDQDDYSLSSVLELSSDPSFPELTPESVGLTLVYNSSPIGTQKIEYGNFPEDSTFIYARVKTTTGGSGITPRIFYSNVLTIFKETPTISYRKNYLGINYKLPTTTGDDTPYKDAILVIGETSGRNKIHYVGASGLGYICGFIIEGGTWDTETNE